MAMEFLAATKDGVFIYDLLSCFKNEDEAPAWAKGHGVDGISVKVVATLPSPPNAFGHSWSSDGLLLASVCDEGVRIYSAPDGYKQVLELEKVAPDVGGRAGGVRTTQFSPKTNFMVTYEKWDPQYPVNTHVWAVTGEKRGERLYSSTLKGYTSGALPVEMICWTFDESSCLELSPGSGIIVRDGSLSTVADEEGDEGLTKLIPEKAAGNFVVSPAAQKGACYVAVFVPESGGMVARVVIYHLADPSKATMEIHLPPKVKDCKLLWNSEGSAILVLASSDVDETGSSYFGTTYLYWLRPEGRAQLRIYGAADGQVQDLAWSPTANEFMVIVGMMPATVAIFDGKTGKLSSTLGSTRRNTLKWNPFGRFAAVGGFGTLAGDLDFYDRSKEETISSLRAALTVNCDWAPDGRQFLTATVAPRMNEGNQISIYKYTGERVISMNFKPDHVEGRHEDTGAGARTKTQALLYAASWRPTPGAYQDRAASPPRPGVRRKKGLPEGAQNTSVSSSGPAYRPRGEAGGSVAAMMRGEVDLPTVTPNANPGGWGEVQVAPKLEEWEIRKIEKQRKKDEEKKALEEKEKEKQTIRDIEQAEKDKKKRIKELKAQLAAMDEIKEKDWDELTDEDEEILEGEIALRNELAELEKGK